MIETNEFKAKGYYLFESLASGRTCYFESKEEVRIFGVLLRRYLNNYVEIHKIFLSSEGYQILIRVKSSEVLKKHYKLRCEKRSLKIRFEFLTDVWRIVSDQIRILHSVFAKWVNRNRDRNGVLVQCKYKKFYFESKESFDQYLIRMKKGNEIKSQRNMKYSVSKRWKNLVNWIEVRKMKFNESVSSKAFYNYVVENLIKSTLSLHSPPP